MRNFTLYKTCIENAEQRKKNDYESELFKINTYTRPIKITEDQLHKGILTLGSTGSGKTVLIKKLVGYFKELKDDKYSMIMIDSKGDYDHFCDEDDIVVNLGYSTNMNWNIFSEILVDGWDESAVLHNCLEIASLFFSDKENEQQKFFTDAAQLILYFTLVLFIEKARRSLKERENLNNFMLRKFLLSLNSTNLKEIYDVVEDAVSLEPIVGISESAQSIGVFAELHLMVHKYFSKDISTIGDWSIRAFIRHKNNKTLLLRVDPALLETRKVILNLFVRLLQKEVKCINASRGKTIFVCDEAAIVGKMEELDVTLNHARSKGVVVCIGFQSIAQLYEIYGEHSTNSILAGLKTKFIFSLDDKSSLEYIQKLYGEHTDALISISRGGNKTQISKQPVLSTADIYGLQIGECYYQFDSKPQLYKIKM